MSTFRLAVSSRTNQVIALIAFVLCSALAVVSQADEGMFPVSEIAKLDLNAKGLKMAPEDIFNPDKTCLIDGICRVNGCTGSFVSPNGLIITNHHCAYRAIQSASSTDHDYLADGFQAKTMGEEIPAPGYTCLLYTSPSPRDATLSRMPSSA